MYFAIIEPSSDLDFANPVRLPMHRAS